MGETETSNKKNPVKWLFSAVKAQGRWLYVNILAALADAVMAILIAYYMNRLIDVALYSFRKQELIPVIIAFAFIIPFAVLQIYLRSYSAGRINAGVMYDIRCRIYEHIEKLPVAYLENNHSAETASSAVNDVSKIENFLSMRLSRIIYIPAAFVITFTYMLVLKWNLLLFSFIVIPVVMAISFLIVLSVGKLTYQLQGLIGESNAIVNDTITGMPIVKAYNLENTFFKRYSGVVNKTIEKGLHIIMRISAITPLLFVLRQAPAILSVIYGGYLIAGGQMTPGELLAFLYLLNILVGIIVDIPDLMGEVSKASGVVKHVLELLEQPREAEGGCALEMDYDKEPFEAEDISFSYDGTARVLEGVSLKIRRGTVTALVGPSGSGKSTLFKLLCGYYQPQAGKMRLFGSEINGGSLSFCRSQISVVTQDSYLFPVSILENISYGRPGASTEEIVAAAKAANAHEFITGLPQGYDTVAGERGTRLSGGQKQRIAIARAILKGAPILMLDEPTSALDNQSEALIQEAVEKLKGEKTILVIAHRLSTIQNADEVLVLKDGHIAERGTHQELFEKDGFYKQLYVKQYTY